MKTRFCPQCGQRLTSAEAFGRQRPLCPACGYVHFDDPKVAVGVVADRDGRILLTRRSHEPAMGCWSFPSGYVDAGEDVRDAAVREALEETGLPVAIEALLGVYSRPGDPVIFIAYAARVGEGEPQAGEEALEVAFFPPGALPDLSAFPHDQHILAAWEAWRAGRRGEG